MFTDADLASRFIKANGLSDQGLAIAGFDVPEEAIKFLRTQEANGLEYVCPDPGRKGAQAWCRSTQSLIAALENAVRVEPDEDERF